MGCNCKNKVKKLEKYSDEGVYVETKLSFFQKILKILLQFVFGIFCGAVIIVMIVPVLLYVIFCLMTGNQATFKLKRLKRE